MRDDIHEDENKDIIKTIDLDDDVPEDPTPATHTDEEDADLKELRRALEHMRKILV